MIDTHSHVNFNAFKSDADEVIKKALDENIAVINVGSQFSTSARAVRMAEKFPTVYASIGMHPIHLQDQKVKNYIDKNETVEFVSQQEEFDYQKYIQLAKSSNKVVAIGESGLDYFHLEQNSQTMAKQKEEQKKLFRQHIRLANELSLPMIIHCRLAYADMIHELNENKVKCGGVLHCFVGNAHEAEQILELGFYLGFTGVITFKNIQGELLDIIKNTPIDRILAETDCPYLSPEPYRGQRNEPAFVKFVVRKIAEIKGLEFEQAVKRLDNNAKKIFRIDF